jgi:hypothetical protein
MDSNAQWNVAGIDLGLEYDAGARRAAGITPQVAARVWPQGRQEFVPRASQLQPIWQRVLAVPRRHVMAIGHVGDRTRESNVAERPMHGIDFNRVHAAERQQRAQSALEDLPLVERRGQHDAGSSPVADREHAGTCATNAVFDRVQTPDGSRVVVDNNADAAAAFGARPEKEVCGIDARIAVREFDQQWLARQRIGQLRRAVQDARGDIDHTPVYGMVERFAPPCALGRFRLITGRGVPLSRT